MLEIQPGSVLSDRYTVGRRLGVGGTGVVWQAHDAVLRRDVALKVVRTGEQARLEREARAAAGVNDSNVVAVYDAGADDGTMFLVMELVEGVDLAQLLSVCGALDPAATALVGRDLARGLAAVHDGNIIHRDIKPSNVMLTTSGQVKIGDLGIARTSDATATAQLTETGTIVGTIDYLAPEQLGEDDVSLATDVYSLGLLVLECATGTKPFGEGTLAARAARRLTRTPDIPDHLHADLRHAIDRAVRRDPEERPQHGRELAALLDRAVVDEEATRNALRELIGRTRATPVGDRQSRDPVSDERPGVHVATVTYTPTGAVTPGEVIDGVEVGGSSQDASPLSPVATEAPQPGEARQPGSAGHPSAEPAASPDHQQRMRSMVIEVVGGVVAVIGVVTIVTALTG